MASAKPGDLVAVHYTGRLDDGSVFATTRNRRPLEVTLGHGRVIAGVEEALVGMEPGQHQDDVVVDAGKAYGPYRPELTVAVSRDELPDDVDPRVGDELLAASPEGEQVAVTVIDVSTSAVVLDLNHRLAGKTLHFDLELVAIRETPAPL
ncbi:MAG: peptidylprolyl isomerase [Vicinamibacterales bacterium]